MRDASHVFASDLLAGRRVVVAGEPPPLLARLGAEVRPLDADLDDEEAVAAAAGAGADVLVVDAGALFAAGGLDGLRAALDRTWNAVRAVATRAFVERERGGRIVMLAPRPGAGPHAEAARAGLENMARTLSIEWSRFGITTVTVAPGEETTGDEVAQLVAYLASPAAGYFSGTALVTA